MTRPAVLIVSNGHGEDAVGALLARRLAPYADVAALPLVGMGLAYADVPLLDPRADLPSGGFGARGGGWLADLRTGEIRRVGRQRHTLAGRGRVDHAVAVGDVFCLWMAAAASAPVTLIATAKSARHDPHGWLETQVIRRFADSVFARDEETAAALRAAGIDAACVGNPLMDTVGIPVSESWRRPDCHVVLLLPGSRADAYRNLAALLRLAGAADPHTPVRWLCALASTIDPSLVAATAAEAGWSCDADSRLTRGTAAVLLTEDFSGGVRDADVVVSLAGTASEQAAGMGRPVVAFPGGGTQFTAAFLAAQQRLLGDALVAAPDWTGAAAAVRRLLGDPDERLRRGAAGRLRMGPPGGLNRIADAIGRKLVPDAR